jgi:hypothetical protein
VNASPDAHRLQEVAAVIGRTGWRPGAEGGDRNGNRATDAATTAANRHSQRLRGRPRADRFRGALSRESP